MHNRLVGHDFLVIIAHLQPGVLHRLTGVPLKDLTNQYVDAELLLTGEVNHFHSWQLHSFHVTAGDAVASLSGPGIVF